VIRRDHRVKLTAHCAHENRVGGEWTGDFCRSGGRGEKLAVLAAKPAAVARVWIERAKSDARLGNSVPVTKPIASDARRVRDRLDGDPLWNLAQRNMGRSEHNTQLV